MDILSLPKKPKTGSSTEADEQLTADEANQIIDELLKLITSGGISKSTADKTQLAQALARYASGGVYYQDTGAANAYVLSSPSGTNGFVMPKSYFVGMQILFRVGTGNGGSATVDVNGIGIKNIKKEDGTALAGGELATGQLTMLEYDGAAFRVTPWANALNLGGGGGGYLNMPVYPEIIETGNVMSVITAAGTLTVNPGQSWLHRGWKKYSTDDYALASRQFTTAANKTYHLRWSLTNGFALKDLADTGYNPGALAETDASFDTKYDDMLIAKVETDGGNVLTVTALANASNLQSELYGAPRGYSGVNEADHIYNFYYGWARTPKYALSELHPPGNSYDSDYQLYSQIKTREHLQMWSWTWQHSGTTTYPAQSLGFRLNMEA